MKINKPKLQSAYIAKISQICESCEDKEHFSIPEIVAIIAELLETGEFYLPQDPELKTLTKRFFEILDTKEESDSGNEFSPVFISCCRVLLGEKLGKILPRMKELSND
jgi:hypothetical protein